MHRKNRGHFAQKKSREKIANSSHFAPVRIFASGVIHEIVSSEIMPHNPDRKTPISAERFLDGLVQSIASHVSSIQLAAILEDAEALAEEAEASDRVLRATFQPREPGFVRKPLRRLAS
jgi:hypothetical protein